MLLLSLLIHLLSDLSKDAHGVEYEGERGVELQLLEVNMPVGCV